MGGPERTVMFQMPTVAQPRLVGFDGTVKGRVFPLSAGTYVIGRGEACDLPLRDAGVSREHAKIVAESDAYMLFDLDSRNGTFLNGKPARKATLQEGDEIRICNVALRFTYVDVQPSIPPEMSLEDPTDNVALDGPTAPHARPGRGAPSDDERARWRAVTAPHGMAPGVGAAANAQTVVPTVAPAVAPEVRALRWMVIIALLGTLLAGGGVVGVLLIVSQQKQQPVVVMAPATPAPTTTTPTPKTSTPPPPPALPAPPPSPTPTPTPTPTPVASDPPKEPRTAPRTSTKRPKDRERGQASESNAPSEWLVARTGPELVRAPEAGTVTSFVTTAVPGKAVVVVDGQDVIASAAGPVTPSVGVGEAVRKGQVLARVADTRVRVAVPAAHAKRARRGAAVELQLDDGGTRVSTVQDVVAGVMFIDAPDGTVRAVRFP